MATSRKKKQKRASFKGKVGKNSHDQKNKANAYGHLILPKGVNLFRESPKTRNKIDILPYVVTSGKHPDRDDEYGVAVPGELWYKRPYWLHRNIGPANETIACPRSIGEPCPICEYQAKLKKDGAKWDDDNVKELKASMRNLYYVVPLGMKDFEEEPHIWDIAQFCFQDKLNDEIEEDETYETFPDPEDGFTLSVRFSEEKIGKNMFNDTSRIDFKPRANPISDEMLDSLTSLDDVLDIKPYKVIEALLFGGLDTVVDDDDYDEEEEEERPSKRKSMSKHRHDEDDEDEEEDEDDEEDEDEEEEAPRKKSKSSSHPSKSHKRTPLPKDEEDEEEDEEEEGDEEEPVRKSSKSKPTPKPSPKSKRKPAPEPEEEEDEDEEEDEEEDEDDDDGMITCVACEGSGTNSKGRQCPICKGEGVVPEEDEEDEEEEEEEEEDEPPKKSKSKASSKKAAPPAKSKSKGGNKCPHGHVFGKDCEEFEDCDDCDKWEECVDAK